MVDGLRRAWDDLVARGARAMVLASANPMLFCAGADIKAFTTWDSESGRAHLEQIHALSREWERSPIVTIAAVNGMALGGGCEIAMACDVRLAAVSASFGQPEINLGIIPGFGGTQRLPRLVGPAKALELNTLGDPISAEEAFEYGLVNRVVHDHELFDTALAWARKARGPGADRRWSRSSASRTRARSRRGAGGRDRRLHDRLRLRGRARGHRGLHREARRRSSRAGERGAARLAELIRSAPGRWSP